MTRWILTATLVLTLLFMSGCQVSGEEMKAWYQDQLETSREVMAELGEQAEELQAQLDANRAELEDIPDDDSLADRIRDAIEKGSETLEDVLENKDRVAGVVSDLEAKIESIDAEGTSGTIVGLEAAAHTIQTGSAAVGGPVQLGGYAISAVLLGIAGFMRKKQIRAETALLNTVHAIDVGKRSDTAFMNAIDNAGGTIRAAMGPETARTVDALRAKTTP